MCNFVFFRSTNQHHQIQLATYCLPNIRLSESSSHYTFTLKVAIAMFAETLDNSQHLTRLNPESPSFTLNFLDKPQLIRGMMCQ
jgi:hypothetical protein